MTSSFKIRYDRVDFLSLFCTFPPSWNSKMEGANDNTSQMSGHRAAEVWNISIGRCRSESIWAPVVAARQNFDFYETAETSPYLRAIA